MVNVGFTIYNVRFFGELQTAIAFFRDRAMLLFHADSADRARRFRRLRGAGVEASS